MTSWLVLIVVGLSLQNSDGFSSTDTLCDYTEEDHACKWDTLYEYPKYQVFSLGSSIVLPCNYTETPDSAVAKSWMLSDLKTIVPLNWTSRDGRLWVSTTDGMTHMHINNITTEDFGFYHCMMQADSNTAWMLRIGLNVQGPYFEDLWEKYKWMSLAGTCAFFGFILLDLWVWLIYRYRWKPSEDELSDYMPSRDRSRKGSSVSRISTPGSVGSKEARSRSGSTVSSKSSIKLMMSDGQSNPVYYDEIGLESYELENTAL